jgi:hypothetical protein
MGSHITEAVSTSDAAKTIKNVLKDSPRDIPFATIYLPEQNCLSMITSVRIDKGNA